MSNHIQLHSNLQETGWSRVRSRIAMACIQGKYQGDSPSRSLEKMKMDSGYFPKGKLPATHRRSTGQRNSGRLYDDEPDCPWHRRKNVGFGSGETGGSGKEGKHLRDGYGERGGGGERADEMKPQRVEFGEEELIDGWPKWLVDNVPREV